MPFVTIANYDINLASIVNLKEQCILVQYGDIKFHHNCKCNETVEKIADLPSGILYTKMPLMPGVHKQYKIDDSIYEHLGIKKDANIIIFNNVPSKHEIDITISSLAGFDIQANAEQIRNYIKVNLAKKDLLANDLCEKCKFYKDEICSFETIA